VWYPVKLLNICYNLFAGTDMLSISVYEPTAIQILLGGTVPQFGRSVELGDRMWYTVKLLHICYNLFAGTEVLSLSVYEPIAIQILLGGTVSQFGRGVELEGRVCYPVKLLHISCNLFAGTEMLSLTVYKPIAIQILLGRGLSPNLAEGSS